jgi:NADPH-dependent 2,4-dienoyl-CoA reductase/sulfur reductase-like enzyme/rhodanese-related sulfurtransferase
MSIKKICIVGGGAAGASCAMKARRLAEHSKILLFEQGEYVSFANCGLPYYVGNVVTKRDKLRVVEPEVFNDWHNIEVRTLSRVQSVDRDKKEITVRDNAERVYVEKYDYLVLAQGAAPFLSGLPQKMPSGVFTLSTISDADKIISWIGEKGAKSAVVLGGGLIGLEMAENLRRLELRVTLVERLPQIASFLDAEMALFLADHLETHGVELVTGDKVVNVGINTEKKIATVLGSGKKIVSDMAVLALGVRPENRLAASAGIETGESGGIRVDGSMKTSDPFVYAIGDCAEIRDAVFPDKGNLVVRFAGPAEREGRIAAESIAGLTGKRRARTFRGSQRTSVCGVFGMTAACTGANERQIKGHNTSSEKRIDYEKVYMSPLSNVGYYPGSSPIFIKLLFEKKSGRILGAQAVGMKGVEKRIDVISMAIQMGGTVFDLEESELCYAPQYGSARDPVNMAGMVAGNVVRNNSAIVHWESLPKKNVFLLDVRTASEFESGHIPGAAHIPLHALRSELDALPKDREILVYCQRGQRSHYATRILVQHGFDAKNISGGYIMHETVSRTLIKSGRLI